MVCKKCGYQNSQGAVFCSGCGAKLDGSENRSNTSRNKIIIACLLIALILVMGYLTIHDWTNATCTEPVTCTICKKTQGEPQGHQWLSATCTDPERCYVCGATGKAAKGHDWIAATCTEPQRCSVCGTTNGSVSEHLWMDATYDSPKKCSYCGITEGKSLGDLGTVEQFWSTTPTSLGGWEVYPRVMNEPINNCDYFVLHVIFGEYSENPDIYNVIWDIYVKTTEGEWIKIMDIPVDGPEIWWPWESWWFDTGEPVSFTELAMVPQNATFSSYNFFYEVQEVRVTG